LSHWLKITNRPAQMARRLIRCIFFIEIKDLNG
jgi:hypothetical protein